MLGGLFKDFLTDLSKLIFDPNYGLFSMTTNQYLYPNPNASSIFGAIEQTRLFNFLGKSLLSLPKYSRIDNNY